jgi:hypothetical protein
MIRPSSKRSVLLVVSISLCACAARAPGKRGPSFPTAAELPEVPRKPDGVVVDPSPELPPAVDVAEPSSPLVTLKPPLPEKAARTVISAFFRAVVAEDIDALGDLSTPDASAPNKSRGTAGSIVDHWRTRMRHFRYRAFSGEVLYHDADIEFYRYDDLETTAVGRPERPPEMARSDLLLRVPMLVVRAGTDRAFGDEIFFLLRRDKDRFRIRQTTEDFQLP